MSGPGIDYGMGITNIDQETGIRYGIISQNSVCPESMDDVYNNGTDLAWEGAKQELTKQLADALYEVLEDTSLNDQKAKDIAQESAEALMDDIAGDALDNSGESGPFQYEQDGYQLQTTMDNELFVFKSPFYTYAKFCSPCVPGAGNLDATAKTEATEEEMSQYGIKTYCLDGSWFDGGVAPYPIFKVS